MASIIKANQLQDFGGNSILTSDGSGNVTVNAVGLKNTPFFYGRSTGTQNLSNSTSTVITFDTADYNTGSEFDTSNGKFIPANGSTYLLHGQLKISTSINATLQEARIQLYKNGSEVLEMRNDTYTTGTQYMSPSLSKIVTGNGSDYYQIYGHIYIVGGATPSTRSGSFFTGHKLIGA